MHNISDLEEEISKETECTQAGLTDQAQIYRKAGKLEESIKDQENGNGQNKITRQLQTSTWPGDFLLWQCPTNPIRGQYRDDNNNQRIDQDILRKKGTAALHPANNKITQYDPNRPA